MPPEQPALDVRSALAALAILGLLGVLTLLDIVEGPDGPRDERIAATPELPRSAGDLPGFVGASRYYLTKRYAFRTWFIETNSAVKRRLFGHPAYPDVLVGEDGFLFLATEGTIPLTQGADPLTGAEREAWRTAFAAQADAFSAVGLPYIFVLAPMKHSIYPEKLPEWLQPGTGPGRRTDAVLAIAREELDIPPLDLRETFAAARRADPGEMLYHRTDTHWNERGAALALQTALGEAGIATRLPEMQVQLTEEGGDLSRMLGRQAQSSEAAPRYDRRGWQCRAPDGAPLDIVTLDPLLPAEVSCSGTAGRDLRVLAFVDSFGIPAIPFLAANFNEVRFVRENRPDAGLAADMGADLVLNILVERRLQTADPATMVPDAPR